jgi:hypothetical protein
MISRGGSASLWGQALFAPLGAKLLEARGLRLVRATSTVVVAEYRLARRPGWHVGYVD